MFMRKINKAKLIAMINDNIGDTIYEDEIETMLKLCAGEAYYDRETQYMKTSREEKPYISKDGTAYK